MIITKPYYDNICQPLMLIISFKFLTNASFWIGLYCYLTNALNIFKILAPINFVNSIIFYIIFFLEWDKVLISVVGNDKFKKIDLSRRQQIINNDEKLQFYSAFYSIIVHLISSIIIYILLVRIPNYSNDIGIRNFILGSLFVLFYTFTTVNNPYGEINYQLYLIIYMVMLLILNLSIYK